jgi:hypothetical protein
MTLSFLPHAYLGMATTDFLQYRRILHWQMQFVEANIALRLLARTLWEDVAVCVSLLQQVRFALYLLDMLDEPLRFAIVLALRVFQSL